MLASHHPAVYGTLVAPLMICSALGFSLPRSIIHATCSTLARSMTTVDDALHGNRIPFCELGLNPKLCDVLRTKLGLEISTNIQAKAIPAILHEDSKTVIMGAETGSGKTLAYLLPLIEKAVREKGKKQRGVITTGNTTTTFPQELLGKARGWDMFPRTIVLAPSRELCDQVMGVARKLLDGLEEKTITVDALHGMVADFPYTVHNPAPEILVCTPSFLAGFGGLRNIPLFIYSQTLVLDEADMLLEGHFRKQVDDVLQGFRRADNLNPAYSIPPTQYILAAATLPNQGLRSIAHTLEKLFPRAEHIITQYMHREHPAMSQQWIKVGPLLEDKVSAVVELLKQEDKNNGGGVEYSNPNNSRRRRTMIFTNSAESCSVAARAMRAVGLNVAEYHADLGPGGRSDALNEFHEGHVNTLVCTDLASRGLDIPGVTHIIQLEFASNVVQHIHRLGRAARAGELGRAINLWDGQGSSNELVKLIQKAGSDITLDKCFSRRRGLRKGIRKQQQWQKNT